MTLVLQDAIGISMHEWLQAEKRSTHNSSMHRVQGLILIVVSSFINPVSTSGHLCGVAGSATMSTGSVYCLSGKLSAPSH